MSRPLGIRLFPTLRREAAMFFAQLGLSPRLKRRNAKPAPAPLHPLLAEEAETRRRSRRRLLLSVACGVFAAMLWTGLRPPPGGAMVVFFAPWVDAEEAGRRIYEAGGVVLETAEDFGFGQLAVGADSAFAGEMLSKGGLTLNARPALWMVERVAGLF